DLREMFHRQHVSAPWLFLGSMTENDVPGVAEGVAARDDDAISGREAFEYLDARYAHGAEPHRRSHGEIIFHAVGVAATLIGEAAPIHRQHVVAAVDEHAYGESLVLPQPLRAIIAQAHAGDDLPVHHLGRHAAHGAGPVLAAASDLRPHAGG